MLIHYTGRWNYNYLSNKLGIDLINNPELLSQPKYAVLSSYVFWNKRRLNAIADKNDIASVTVRINGGMNGFSERRRWFNKFYSVIH